MRFSSADSLSPFELGGLNTYAYCNGDPVNYSDHQGTYGIFSNLRLRLMSPPTDFKPGRISGRGQFTIGQTSSEVKSERAKLRQHWRRERRIVQATNTMKRRHTVGVNIALDLLEHEPDLFSAVMKHLNSNDLHKPTYTDTITRARLTAINTRVYNDHIRDIVSGQQQRQPHPILTHSQHSRLDSFESKLVNAYAPHTARNRDLYSDPEQRANQLLFAQARVRDAEKVLRGKASPYF